MKSIFKTMANTLYYYEVIWSDLWSDQEDLQIKRLWSDQEDRALKKGLDPKARKNTSGRLLDLSTLVFL